MSAHSIIIGYDASTEAKAAAAWALDEASRIGAQVEFFYAYEWPTWAPATATVAPPEVWPGGEIDRAIKGMLDQAITSARLSHPQVHTEISIVNGAVIAGKPSSIARRNDGREFSGSVPRDPRWPCISG